MVTSFFQHSCGITAIDLIAWIKTAVHCGPSVFKCRSWGPKTSKNSTETRLWGTHEMRDIEDNPEHSLRSGKCMVLRRVYQKAGVLQSWITDEEDFRSERPPGTKSQLRKTCRSLCWRGENMCITTISKILHTSWRCQGRSGVCSRTPEGSFNKLEEGFVFGWNQRKTFWHEYRYIIKQHHPNGEAWWWKHHVVRMFLIFGTGELCQDWEEHGWS